VTWTTELANAEVAESAYRAGTKSFLNSYMRWDGRGSALLGTWIGARAAASSTKVPASNAAYWANVAARATVAMTPSWSVVTSLITPAPGPPFLVADVGAPYSGEMFSHQPFGFPGNLDGLLDGLLSPWTTSVWTTSGRTVPAYSFPSNELWTYLFAQAITNAGPT
jgi:hypothetical protein